MFPRWKIHVGKVDPDLAANFGVIRNRDIVLLGFEVCQAVGPVRDTASIACDPE